METKELIKKLRTCSYLDENLNEIVANHLEQLEKELESVKAERDAAVKDLTDYVQGTLTRCQICKYTCDWCYYDSDEELNFEWRGIRKDN